MKHPFEIAEIDDEIIDSLAGAKSARQEPIYDFPIFFTDAVGEDGGDYPFLM